MPSLTRLPIALQARILRYLLDEEVYDKRASLAGSNHSLSRHTIQPYVTLADAEQVHASLPVELLAPALASPILAAAAHTIFIRDGLHMFAYLTDINTEGNLPLWVTAFASFVTAVSAGHVVDVWCRSLPATLRRVMLERVSTETTQLFTAITVNQVRLRVLDLVHVPFHECSHMQDAIMSGLCGTLEAIQHTLRELALPVYLQSDLCASALEIVTLPHLLVLSAELKNVPYTDRQSFKRRELLRRPFLRIMQAVDGHADRSRGLTTLNELRFINMYDVPCTNAIESRCSPAFFSAVTTVRVGVNQSVTYLTFREPSFLALFRNLQYLYVDILLICGNAKFRKIYAKLKEVHLCHRRWLTGVQVGAIRYEPYSPHDGFFVQQSINMSNKNIVTLGIQSDVDAIVLRRIALDCPNLQYLSLYVTSENVYALRRLIRKCEWLVGLEVVIAEHIFGSLGKDGWQALAKMIPRHHTRLSELSIETKYRYQTSGTIRADHSIDCFVAVTKRLGLQAKILKFRASVKSRMLVHLINGLCRILDTCASHSPFLNYLKVDIIPHKGKTIYDAAALNEAKAELRSSKDHLERLIHNLRKVDLGFLHSYSST